MTYNDGITGPYTQTSTDSITQTGNFTSTDIESEGNSFAVTSGQMSDGSSQGDNSTTDSSGTFVATDSSVATTTSSNYGQSTHQSGSYPGGGVYALEQRRVQPIGHLRVELPGDEH